MAGRDRPGIPAVPATTYPYRVFRPSSSPPARQAKENTMNERDELRGTLANTICNASNYPRRATPYLLGEDMSPVLNKSADAILAAGYRKPRTITTVEELDALPAGTVIRDGDPLTCIKWGDGTWGTFAGDSYPPSRVTLAATVLHEPGPQP